MASATNAKGDSRRLRAALDECGLSLLAQKFAEHGVDDSCLSAIEDEDLQAMGIAQPASRSLILAVLKAPLETSSERVAALEARNRELVDALDAATASAAAHEARFTEALQIAGRLRCQFAHSLDELRPGPATHRQKVEHRYKTKMCKYFLAGHCPYVATGTCQFAHSRDELMAGRGSIHRAEYMNVGPAGTLPRAAFNWRDPTVLAAVGQLGGSFDDVGESAQAWPAPARFGEEAPTE